MPQHPTTLKKAGLVRVGEVRIVATFSLTGCGSTAITILVGSLGAVERVGVDIVFVRRGRVSSGVTLPILISTRVSPFLKTALCRRATFYTGHRQ